MKSILPILLILFSCANNHISEKRIENYEKAKKEFEAMPLNLNNSEGKVTKESFVMWYNVLKGALEEEYQKKDLLIKKKMEELEKEKRIATEKIKEANEKSKIAAMKLYELLDSINKKVVISEGEGIVYQNRIRQLENVIASSDIKMGKSSLGDADIANRYNTILLVLKRYRSDQKALASFNYSIFKKLQIAHPETFTLELWDSLFLDFLYSRKEALKIYREHLISDDLIGYDEGLDSEEAKVNKLIKDKTSTFKF